MRAYEERLVVFAVERAPHNAGYSTTRGSYGLLQRLESNGTVFTPSGCPASRSLRGRFA